MTTLGKYLAGGLSFGAFGGRADLMAAFDPARGGLTHGGTFNNNAFTMAVGAAVGDDARRRRRPGRGERARRPPARRPAGPLRRLAAAVLRHRLGLAPERPPGPGPVASPADLDDADPRWRELFFHDLLDAGFYTRAAWVRWRCRWTSPTTTPARFLDAVERFADAAPSWSDRWPSIVELSAGRGPAHGPRRPGLRRPPPGRPRRPPPPAQGVRPHRRDPDRLGQRARAQPGAAAVRPPRAAPAHDARRRHRRRRAVRVLGPHGGASCPSAQHRLFRWRMDAGHQWTAIDRLAPAPPELPRRGARPGPRRRSDHRRRPRASGSARRAAWWDWDDGKIALEHLFHHGAASPSRRRRSDFARLYDLPERVLPASVLAAPTPTEAEARKELLALAARSLGVGHARRPHRLPPPGATRRASRSSPSSSRRACCVRRPSRAGSKPAYVHRDADVPRAVDGPGAAQPVRLAGLEPRAHRAAVRLPLPHRDLHAAAEAGLRLLRAAVPARRRSSSGASTSRPTGPPGCCACRGPTPSRASTGPAWPRQPRRRAALDGRLARARRGSRRPAAATWRRRCARAGRRRCRARSAP